MVSYAFIMIHGIRRMISYWILPIVAYHVISMFCSYKYQWILHRVLVSNILLSPPIVTQQVNITCSADVNHSTVEQNRNYVIKTIWIWYISMNVFACIQMRLYLITPCVKRKETHKSIKRPIFRHTVCNTFSYITIWNTPLKTSVYIYISTMV